MAILQTQRVLTLDYWKFASDISPGDIVFNRHGNPVRVKLVQKYRAPRCYEVTFTDGLTIAGDDHLVLPLENEKYRNRARQHKGHFKFSRPTKQTKMSDLYNLPLYGRENRKIYSVPTAGELQFPHQTLPVPPFVFGFWFFNRKADNLMRPLPGHKDFIYEKFKEAGYKPIEKDIYRDGNRNFITTPTVISHLVPLIPTSIPNNYLLASAEQRNELFMGILYSRIKNIHENPKRIKFSNKKKLLITQLQYLAESLGYRTTLNHNEVDNFYTVLIRSKVKHATSVRKEWRLVASIREIEPQGCVHIETDGEDGSILVGEGFIPCH